MLTSSYPRWEIGHKTWCQNQYHSFNSSNKSLVGYFNGSISSRHENDLREIQDTQVAGHAAFRIQKQKRKKKRVAFIIILEKTKARKEKERQPQWWSQ